MSRRAFRNTRLPSCSASTLGSQEWLIHLAELPLYFAVDDVAVVEVEVESVVGLLGRGDGGRGFFPGDDFTLVLDDGVAGRNGLDRIHALAAECPTGVPEYDGRIRKWKRVLASSTTLCTLK